MYRNALLCSRFGGKEREREKRGRERVGGKERGSKEHRNLPEVLNIPVERATFSSTSLGSWNGHRDSPFWCILDPNR